MALLRIREIAALSDEFACGYKIKDVLVLSKSFTKSARAMTAIGNKTNERTSVRFAVAEFDRLVAQIAKDARRRKSLTAADYYPPSRDPAARHESCHWLILRYWRRFHGIWMSV